MQEDQKLQTQVASGGSVPQSIQNSGTKRAKKTQRKIGQSESSQSMSSPRKEDRQALKDKYQGVAGACEWFQVRKIELETQKKSLAGLPIHHQWKPPRMDQDKYQADMSILNEKGFRDEEEEENSMQLRKRKRSYSADLGSEMEEAKPVKKVFMSNHAMYQKEEEKTTDLTHRNEKLTFNPDKANRDEQQMQDYLDIVDFIMRETSTSCNGVWLKGSPAYHEKAMLILQQYDYNYNLAKFHILYPSVMALPSHREEVMTSLNEKELESIVNEAIIDLRGCKTQEAEEAIENIRNAVKNRITIEDLQYYQQVLKKMRIDTPQDIEQQIQNSRDFSKQIKKKCGPQTGGGAAAQIPNDKKMKMSELQQMQQESLNYFIISPEMQLLSEYEKRALAWIDKAETVREQVVNVKHLQNLVQEARSIPVNFEQLIEEVKERTNSAQDLIERIHGTFIKVNKTRTQIGSEQQSQKKKIVDHAAKTKKHSENVFRNLVKEADALRVTNTEIQKLKQHLEEVEQWKNRVNMFLEDEREQIERKDIFSALIRETSLFKIELPLSKDLQRRLEFIEWRDKVNKIWNQMKPGETQQKVPTKVLQQLMQEGEQKGFEELPIEEVIQVGEMCLRANRFEEELCQLLKEVKENKQPVEQKRLQAMHEQGQQLPVTMPEIQDLESKINETEEYCNKCKHFLQFQVQKEDNADQKMEEDYLQQILALRSEIAKLGIVNETFVQFEEMVKPILKWIHHTRQIIRNYYKSIDLQLNQLNLLEQQDYESSESEMEVDQESSQQTTQRRKKKQVVLKEDYEELKYLLEVANLQLVVLQKTRDYQILNEFQSRVEQWIQRLANLEEGLSQEVNIVEHLEKLVSENLPLPQDKYNVALKWLRREKWNKKLQELHNAEKVKIKQIETLAKESNHADIQEDEKFKGQAEDLKLQLQQCKEWLSLQQNTDLATQKDIVNLLDKGRQLKLNLQEFVELKNFYQDVIDWKQISYEIITSSNKKSEYNYEMVRKHIELGVQLDINDKELDILKSMLEMSAHWKSLARKILKSRVLCKLEQQVVVPPVNENESNSFDIILKKDQQQELYQLEKVNIPDYLNQEQALEPKYFDNHQYCICRRGDDGLVFMIECDNCGEWFHGDCVGLQKVTNGKTINYTCIACARIKESFNPCCLTKRNSDEEEKKESFDPSLLSVFGQERRADYEILKVLIEEGETKIAIHLEELEELKQVNSKVQKWLVKVYSQMQQGINAIGLERAMNIGGDDTNENKELIKKKQQDRDFQMHCLYLESESFPVALNESEEILSLVRQRDWYRAALKLISSQSRLSKLQIKKNVKKLQTEAEDLKLDYDPKLLQMLRQVQMLLSNSQQPQVVQAQPQQVPQFNLNYEIEYRLQQGADYGDLVGLIEHTEGNNLIQSLGDRQRIEELKNMLSAFSQWLTEVRECLNSNNKQQPIDVNSFIKQLFLQEFSRLMLEGDKHFWQINSVEKAQFIEIQRITFEWDMQCKNLITELSLQLPNDENDIKFFYNVIENKLQLLRKQFKGDIEEESEERAKEKNELSVFEVNKNKNEHSQDFFQ